MRLASVGALLALVAPAASQNYRPVVTLDNQSRAIYVACASEGDLSVMAYSTHPSGFNPRELRVSFSDGSGRDWSAPQTIATSGIAFELGPSSLQIVDGHVYLFWVDDYFLRMDYLLNAAQGERTFEGAQTVAQTLPALPFVLDWEAAVTRGSDDVRIHVAYTVFTQDSNFNWTPFVSSCQRGSTPGGLTFLPRLLLGTWNPGERAGNNVSVAACGDTAYVGWVESPPPSDFEPPDGPAFLRKTVDAGYDWDALQTSSHGSPVVTIRDGPLLARVIAIDTAGRGEHVAVLLRSWPMIFGETQVEAFASLDGWHGRPITSVLDTEADIFLREPLAPHILRSTVDGFTAAAVFGTRSRHGLRTARFEGQHWLPATTLLDGGSDAHVVAGADGSLGLAWTTTVVHFAHTRDEGRTWTVSTSPLYNGRGPFAVAYNASTSNLVATFSGSGRRIFAGGYRLPTLLPPPDFGARAPRFEVFGFRARAPAGLVFVHPPGVPLFEPGDVVRLRRAGFVTLGVAQNRIALACPIDSDGAGVSAPLTKALPKLPLNAQAVALHTRADGSLQVVESTDAVDIRIAETQRTLESAAAH